MKKFFVVFCLLIFITGLAVSQVRAGGTLFVAVRQLDLRSGTGFFTSSRGRLDYGEQVTVLRVSGRFVEVRSVRTPALTGWAPSANLSARQVLGTTPGTATAREVAMAGKGFTQEVEDTFRAQHDLNFDDVDRIEAITINMEELRRFLLEGRLSLGDN
ncbi:MAG: SH3 domain-containing protein [Treponema sp.]|nr:SH3 domain-containing protein [Treponema sp.]